MAISLIYARSENFCIGIAGDLPWNLPDEYRFFDDTTGGSTIVMGRATYEDHHCLIERRQNIVITSQQKGRFATGIELASSLDHALTLATSDDVFIIGGSGLLSEGFQRATRVFETVVHTSIAGDTFVPLFDFSAWHNEKLLCHPADAQHAFAFTTVEYSRPLPLS